MLWHLLLIYHPSHDVYSTFRVRRFCLYCDWYKTSAGVSAHRSKKYAGNDDEIKTTTIMMMFHNRFHLRSVMSSLLHFMMIMMMMMMMTATATPVATNTNSPTVNVHGGNNAATVSSTTFW